MHTTKLLSGHRRRAPGNANRASWALGFSLNAV
jgi:hypothetical protein